MTMGRNKTLKTKPLPTKSKLKKDLGVPRLPDLKVRNAEKQRLQAKPVSSITSQDPDSTMASEPSLSTLAEQAAEAAASIASSSAGPSSLSFEAEERLRTKEQIQRHYVRTLHKVIEQSDIVIQVLDARDPEGCRSRLVEEEVRRREHEGKKLVFVLNKIDLVPKDNAQAWLRYLRHSTPTLPFRSASQNQRTNLSSTTAPALLKLLKTFKPSAAQSVTVGVVGFPNVGKSSLINSLKRSKVCAVAAQPGHTKDLQSIQLERGLRIVDSPGVIFDDDDEDINGINKRAGTQKGSVLLRNVVKVEDVEDPISVVEEILSRTEHETLCKIYNIPHINSVLEFLTMVALTTGRLLKGGTPDILSAARQILRDWNQHKIPYFSVPPTIHPSSIPSIVANAGSNALAAGETATGTMIAPGAENVGYAQIVKELGKPFELAGLFGAADADVFGDGNGDKDSMEQDGGDGDEMMDEDVAQTETMDQDDLAPRIPRKRSRSPSVVTVTSSTQQLLQEQTDNQYTARAAKRARIVKKDVPTYDAPVDEHARQGMAKFNPLGRKALKHARKAANRAMRAETGNGVGSAGGGSNSTMEVNDGSGLGGVFGFELGSTFMA